MNDRFLGQRGAWQAVTRRLGARHRVGLPVRWRPNEPAPRRRRRRRQPDDHQEAILSDLSVSGARLLLAGGEGVARHRTFDLEIDGCWSRVEVAWVEPSTDPAAVWCGVEFQAADDAFMAAVFAHLPAERGGRG